MGGQRFIASLLIAALVLSGASRSHAARRSGDARLKPTEAQEARDVVLSFLKRFHETGDIAPLADEFFAGDFAARLRTEKDDDRPDGLPTSFLDGEVLRRASPEELQRFFVAEFNFTSVMVGFLTFRYDERKAAGIDDESDSSIAEELPRKCSNSLNPTPYNSASWATGKKDAYTPKRMTPRIVRAIQSRRRIADSPSRPSHKCSTRRQPGKRRRRHYANVCRR
jgi:hypothetical protein